MKEAELEVEEGMPSPERKKQKSKQHTTTADTPATLEQIQEELKLAKRRGVLEVALVSLLGVETSNLSSIHNTLSEMARFSRHQANYQNSYYQSFLLLKSPFLIPRRNTKESNATSIFQAKLVASYE